MRLIEQLSLQNLHRVIREPEARQKARKILAETTVRSALNLNKQYYRRKFSGGQDFLEQKWDTLVLLDACRLDMFNDAFDWTAQPVTSTASESWRFMQTQYVGRDLYDTVYISANPHTSKIPDGTFHAVENLLFSRWDKKKRTVTPEAVTQAALDAHEKYPKKRIIVHFMQPHFPFLGEHGNQVGETALRGDHAEELPAPRNPWFEQMWGDKPGHEILVRAYRENYDVMKPAVEALIDGVNGTVAVSSDHANLIGERGAPVPMRMYGHPRDLFHPALVTVPWVILENNGREIISEEPVVNPENRDNDIAKDRLEALGYR